MEKYCLRAGNIGVQNNDYVLLYYLVCINSLNQIVLAESLYEVNKKKYTLKTFATTDEAKKWAYSRLKKAANILFCDIIPVDAKNTLGQCTVVKQAFAKASRTRSPIVDLIEMDAKSFTNSNYFNDYLKNRLSQLTKDKIKQRIDIEDIRETKKARQLFFVDLYEDNSEMMFIADSLSQMQQHLRTCFQHNVWFIPLQSELIPSNIKVYYGHVNLSLHVILYRL